MKIHILVNFDMLVMTLIEFTTYLIDKTLKIDILVFWPVFTVISSTKT